MKSFCINGENKGLCQEIYKLSLYICEKQKALHLNADFLHLKLFNA